MTGWMARWGGNRGWGRTVLLICVLGVLRSGDVLRAQFQMPDPKQMSGIPRPVGDLPDGSITVLVVRGSVTNGLPGQTVELRVGSKVQTAKTDDAGRVQFDKLPAGETLKASATVDGEHLESQEFPAPAKGGIRLLLAATDTSKGAAAPAGPATTGQVTFAGQSRIILEPGDEIVAVYYLLDIVNGSGSPVNPPKPIAIDLPSGAVRSGLLQGSSPLASVKGTRVTVQGPFPAGSTMVQIGFELPSDSDVFQFSQSFPAALGDFSVIAKKLGPMKLTSPQIAQQQDMTAQGEVYIAGVGGGVAADQAFSVTLSDLPYHSAAPRLTALGLALAVVLIGAWVATRNPGDDQARAAERKRLVARKDKLLSDLVRLEHDRRSGRADERRYATRHEELVAALELVYGALDDHDAPGDPTGSAGIAA